MAFYFFSTFCIAAILFVFGIATISITAAAVAMFILIVLAAAVMIYQVCKWLDQVDSELNANNESEDVQQ